MAKNSNTTSTFETSPTLPSSMLHQSLVNSFQNLHLDGLGFVESAQTDARDNHSPNRASTSGSTGDLVQNSNFSYKARHIFIPSVAHSRVPQAEASGVQKRGIGRVCSLQRTTSANDMGSVNPPSLIGMNNGGHGVVPPIGNGISQLELMGLQERGILSPSFVENPCCQDHSCGLYGGVLQDNWRPYNGFHGSNSMRTLQFPHHLPGGLSFNGRQARRTPPLEENSDVENTTSCSEGTIEPVPDFLLSDYFRFQMSNRCPLQEFDVTSIQVMARDKDGCDYLQKILARRDPLVITKILCGTLIAIFDIMIDQFGNHLFQKLLDACDEEQIEAIIAKITEHQDLLIDVANTQFGTHSVQKLVKMVRRSDHLISCVCLALIPGLKALATNPHGSHVIRSLTQTQGGHYPLLYNAIIDSCLELAVESKGYLTLINFIDNSVLLLRDALLHVILDNSVFLSQDPYGNFVVQHILQLEIPGITEKICIKLEGHYVRLSMQKCGSHVVERCLMSSGRNHVIWELANSDKLDQLACDPYGNFVLQTALKKAEGQLHSMLVKAIKASSCNLKCHLFGRNVYNLLK